MFNQHHVHPKRGGKAMPGFLLIVFFQLSIANSLSAQVLIPIEDLDRGENRAFSNLENATEVGEALQSSISVYPNPFTEKVIVKRKTKVDIREISLVDLNAKVLLYAEGRSLEGAFPLPSLTPGTYVLKVRSSKGLANYTLRKR